jgi:hypothetical protein
LTLFFSVGAILACAATARAGEPHDARRALVEAAWSAHTEGAHARAIVLAEQAIALRKSAALVRFVAEEHAALGHAVEAYARAAECVDLATKEPASPTQVVVLDACRALERDWRPRVGIVKVMVVHPARSGVRVSVAGQASDGDAVVVAPGAVQVGATAPGFNAFASTVDVAPGAEVAVPIALAQPPPLTVAAREAPPLEKPHSVIPPVLIGAGALTVAGGLALHFVANGRYDALRASCAEAARCQDGASEQSAVKRLDGLALGAMIAGSSLVVGGVTFFVLDRRARDRAAWMSVGPGSVRFGGAF